MQGIRIGKEEENGLFEDDMILHVEHLKNLQNNTGANKWICSTDMPNNYAQLVFDKSTSKSVEEI